MADIENRPVATAPDDHAASAVLPEIILGHSNGSLFRSRACSARVSDDGVALVLSDKELTFREMTALRSDPANKSRSPQEVIDSLRSAEGRPLSNIGVSAALALEMDGTTYAVTALQRPSGVLKLISGYVDAAAAAGASPRAELLGAALKEVNEENIVASTESAPPRTLMGVLLATSAHDVLRELKVGDTSGVLSDVGGASLNLGNPYPEAPLVPVSDRFWTIREAPLPAYLGSLHPARTLEVNNEPLAAGFYCDKANNSGQVVFSFRLNLGDLKGASLLHAESAPDPSRPGWLKEVLDPTGIVLLELGADGIPNGRSFWLHAGALLEREIAPTELRLSGAFCPSEKRDGRSTGVVTTRGMDFPKYRQAMSN